MAAELYVYVPNVGFVPLQAGVQSTDTLNQISAPLATSVSNFPATQNVNVTNANSNGQNTMANSAPVVIASNQSTVPVSEASIGANAGTAPTSSTQIGGTDGTNLRPITVAIFHNTDSQSLPTSSYGILTGGIAQIVNASGTIDRQRGTGFDGVPAVGIATGAQQLVGPLLSTTFGAGGVTGNAAAQNVLVASTASMKAGDIIVTQDNVEYVEILSIVDATHCNGVFKNNHASGQTLTWYHYNQARDATVGDATALTGMGASATYLYNNVANTLEFDRSANGEKDGASGQGTAVAAEYEFNGGGPILTGGTLSGLAFDRARNLQGKSLSTATITSTTAGDTVITYGSAAATKTVQPGSPVVLAAGTFNVAANQKEIVYVSASWTPGSAAAVPLQSPVVNTGSTTAGWEVYAFQGPGLNGFTATGIGIEEEALFDPVTQEYFVERAATQDNVAPQNVVIESPGLWNGAGMDRLTGLNGAATFQDWVRYQTLQGKAFSASTGKITSPAAGVQPFQLFNPASSGKNILIYSLVLVYNSANAHTIAMTTVDISGALTGWTNVSVTPVNNKGGGAASVATCNYSSTAATGSSGTTRETTGTANNTPIETLTNGECIFLPSTGTINGVAIYMTTGAAANIGITYQWIEY